MQSWLDYKTNRFRQKYEKKLIIELQIVKFYLKNISLQNDEYQFYQNKQQRLIEHLKLLELPNELLRLKTSDVDVYGDRYEDFKYTKKAINELIKQRRFLLWDAISITQLKKEINSLKKMKPENTQPLG